MKHDLIALLPRDPSGPAPEGLRFHRAGGLAAALSAAPATAPGHGQRRRGARLKSAARRQKQLEDLMAFGTVLPVAPGAVLAPEDLPRLAAANAPLVARTADRLAGRVQFQIHVDWAEDRVLARFRDAPEIAPLFEAPSVSPEAVRAAVARLARRLEGEIAARLDAAVAERAELPRGPGQLANHVVLVDAAKTAALDARLEDIDALWSDGFRIRQIGPAPAASFATLVLRPVSPREIRAAEAVLGLAPGWTGAALDRARTALLRTGGAAPAAVRQAAALLAAHDAAGRPAGPLPLLSLWSEGQAAAAAPAREVA